MAWCGPALGGSTIAGPRHLIRCKSFAGAFSLPIDFVEEDVDFPETAQGELSSEDFNAKYERIIARLKELAANLGTYMWEIGDLLLEADADYNPQNLGIPSYMLIGAHPPNFWKQMSDTVGLGVSALKSYAAVARAFPPAKRFKELTWSHHLAAHIYVDRDKYLQACVERGVEEIGKPHTIRWLEQYIEEQENCVELPTEARRTVSIELPLAMMRKFSDLARHFYHRPVNDIVLEAAKPALEAYLEKKAEEISLQFFNFHDGRTWPFGPEAKKKLSLKRPSQKLVAISRHTNLGKAGPAHIEKAVRRASVITKHAPRQGASQRVFRSRAQGA